jgi:hypothetical protein
METPLKQLLVVLVPCILTTGCVPALYTAAAITRPRASSHVHHEPPAEAPPIGRWDHVMMLEPGTPLKILMMDGAVVTGRFVTANVAIVRLDSGETTSLARVDVMRVDRLGTPRRLVAREAAKGAAVGAGVAGVAGLLLGVTPPRRRRGPGRSTSPRPPDRPAEGRAYFAADVEVRGFACFTCLSNHCRVSATTCMLDSRAA